jgi:hypothetical protein
LDSILGVFLQLGFISVGTTLVVKALPWMIDDPAAFTLFGYGLYNSMPHLRAHLTNLNQILFDSVLYEKETKRKGDIIENGPTPPEVDGAAASSSS